MEKTQGHETFKMKQETHTQQNLKNGTQRTKFFRHVLDYIKHLGAALWLVHRPWAVWLMMMTLAPIGGLKLLLAGWFCPQCARLILCQSEIGPSHTTFSIVSLGFEQLCIMRSGLPDVWHLSVQTRCKWSHFFILHRWVASCPVKSHSKGKSSFPLWWASANELNVAVGARRPAASAAHRASTRCRMELLGRSVHSCSCHFMHGAFQKVSFQ